MPSPCTIAQAAFLCLLLIHGRLALAQQPADPTKQCAPYTGTLHSSQQVATDMFASLVPEGDPTDASGIYLATLLQEVQLAFTPPGTIALLSDGDMRVWLHADGRLTNAHAVDTLLSDEVARALTAAIDSVSRGGGIGPAVPQLRSDSIELRLIVHYADRRTPLSVPLFRVALPPAYFEFQVEKPAVAKGGNPPPKYPTNLREGGIEGDVLALFVVDTAGRVETRTVKILKSSHVDFTRTVRAVLPRMAFEPAELGGCRVRQVVQLPFGFRLNR